jgi:hypothetical protein
MEVDAKGFLMGVGKEELLKRGILVSSRSSFDLLTGRSVEPLIALMQERGATRLLSTSRKWFLDTSGEFSNPEARNKKRGHYSELQEIGNVFQDQNVFINPFCINQ